MGSATDELPLYRLSVEQYHAMRDAGIVTARDRVELLRGVLTPKMTKKPPHALVTRLIRSALEALAPEGCFVDSQEPITTADSEPEPDVAVIRGGPRDFADRHPGPGDVALIVEVADASLVRDRDTKVPLYASAGVAQLWLVDLRARRIEVFAEPSGESYTKHSVLDDGSELSVVIDGVPWGSVAVADLLP